MWYSIIGLAALLLVATSVCAAQDNNGITSCLDNPCLNGSQCEDVPGGFICHCPVNLIGARCEFEANIVTTTMCLASSNSLDEDTFCSDACDGYDATGLNTEWAISGTEGAIGAYIVLHLVDKYDVIGIKYMQRCYAQSHFSKLLVTMNDGSTALMNATCSAPSSDCSDQWESLVFDSAKPDIYLIKMTVLETCSGQVQTNVGFRAIEVLTTTDECTDSNPCLNGGVCVEQDIGYSCNCSFTGFEGDNCEQNIDDCVGVVCDNGGSCVDQVNGYSCLCADGTAKTVCTDPADLECTCMLNGTTLALDVFDEPDLVVYSTGQKTVLSSYKVHEHDPCKFKFQAVTSGNSAPAPLSALTFNIGRHTKNPNKFYRSYKMYGPTVLERGVSKKEKRVTLPYCWSSSNGDTDICIERVGDILQFRSTTCPYALDVNVAETPLSGTLYLEKSANWSLVGMCGDCDDQWNGYVQADGTSVDDVQDEQERYRLITESYYDSRTRRNANVP